MQPLAILLNKDNESFHKITGAHKPKKNEPIVTMCMGGVRGRTAAYALKGLGFTDVR